MAIEKSVFEADGMAMAFERFGNGPRVCLAFHGYGQQSAVFRELPDMNMSVFSIDLPFHGSSVGLIGQGKVKEGVRTEQLQSWVSEFLAAHAVERFELIGYSMGARLVLCSCEALLDRIDSIHLIAPDGFVSNNSYRFATRTMLGRSLFKRLPKYYGAIHRIADIGKAIGVLDRKVHDLVVHHTGDPVRSEQLYNTWTYLRYLRPQLNQLASVLAMESKDIIVHLGEYDTIIPKHKVLKWSLLRDQPSCAIFYERGHRLLVEEIFVEIRKKISLD